MSIYPGQPVWDLTPEGGGEPVLVTVANAKEAVKNDPKRYSHTKPADQPVVAELDQEAEGEAEEPGNSRRGRRGHR